MAANIKCLIYITMIFLIILIINSNVYFYTIKINLEIYMNIVLLGYMGSGKTSVGIRLSSLINKQFFDLDEFIEEKYNQKIHNIFSTKGEIYFRKQSDKPFYCFEKVM